MKKILLVFLTIVLTTNIAAQLNGDGYYRVQNDNTGRYVYVVDNKGSINTSTSSIDMRAISLWKDFEKASSDPATVIYIKNIKANPSVKLTAFEKPTNQKTMNATYKMPKSIDQSVNGMAIVESNGASLIK